MKKLSDKKYFAPKRWTIGWAVSVAHSIKSTLTMTPKRSQKWYELQFKREIAQMKKHIMFFESLLDDFKGEDFRSPKE
jgi:hypothetical protein